jgi:hypothetical protein
VNDNQKEWEADRDIIKQIETQIETKEKVTIQKDKDGDWNEYILKLP